MSVTLHGLYEEWEREERARRQQSERLKDLFKTAKSDGFNPKGLRVAFAEKYALDHDTGEKLQKRSQDASDADLYLATLAGPRRPAYPRVENIEEFDADGVEIEPQPSPSVEQDGGQELSVSSATDIAIEFEDSASNAGQAPSDNAGSSNGRTVAFDAINAGSTPAPAPTLADKVKKLRPLCQQPGSCRSSGGKAHCYFCTNAAAEQVSA